MNSSGGPVRSVSQKRSATQVAEPTASPAKSSASCLDQEGREQRRQLCDVGSPRRLTSKAPRRTSYRPARSGVAAGLALSQLPIDRAGFGRHASAGLVRRHNCSRRLISCAEVDHVSSARFDSHTTEAREATKAHAGDARAESAARATRVPGKPRGYVPCRSAREFFYPIEGHARIPIANTVRAPRTTVLQETYQICNHSPRLDFGIVLRNCDKQAARAQILQARRQQGCRRRVCQRAVAD